MTKDIAKQGNSLFEQIKQTDENGNEFWSARTLSKVLEYSEYRHFIPVLERAKEACKNSGQEVSNHFEDILEMIDLGKTAKRDPLCLLPHRPKCRPRQRSCCLGANLFRGTNSHSGNPAARSIPTTINRRRKTPVSPRRNGQT